MTFQSHASAEFWALYNALPERGRKLARKQYELFAEDPLHPSLRLKPVGLYWSVRVSRTYRALAVRRGREFFWFWIGSHEHYEEVLKRSM